MPASHSVVLPIPASPCNTTAPGVRSSAASTAAASVARPMTSTADSPQWTVLRVVMTGLPADLALGAAALPAGRPPLGLAVGQPGDGSDEQHDAPRPGHPDRPEAHDLARGQATDAPDAD